MSIGILGGSFNPPHIGHLVLAESARDALDLERVFFVPAWRSPFKNGYEDVDPHLRSEMVALAIEGNTSFTLDTCEIGRGDVSYTIDTVRSFHERFPRDTLFLILGSDAFRDFPAWKEPGEILRFATCAVAMRAGEAADFAHHPFIDKTCFFEMPPLDISSTHVRERIRSGRSIRYLVPEAVRRLIIEQNLYR
ncbi:MAG: nicotinate-nucleotide adenylyltransferase [Bacteroidota bacterium]|nr:nicotinate-nucleotide adenylyltransferase [Bacteroidota bacterium]